MRKILLLLLLFSPLFLAAQGKFGFYSHQEVLMSMPEYLQSVEEFELLKQRCDVEIERNEQELTRKYVAFLDGQQDFPEPILRKRQKELQQMVDNSVLFRDRLKEWLSQAKDSLLAPHNGIVDEALARVCERMDLAYAINSDEIMYRYVNPKYGEDITELLIEEISNPSTAAGETECAGEENDEVESCDVDSETVTADAVTGVATDVYEFATDTVEIATEEVTDSMKVATDVE